MGNLRGLEKKDWKFLLKERKSEQEEGFNIFFSFLADWLLQIFKYLPPHFNPVP